ncbi:hypothetical protein ACKVMT_17405 [Halobacteriales archaeon Cl-PHB]
MGYLIGALKYMVNSAIKNTYAMVIFGGATLAVLYLVNDVSGGRPVVGVVSYIKTKYLPPLTPKTFFLVLGVGCVWAGTKWYFRVPRR